jgi:hypothetical protein
MDKVLRLRKSHRNLAIIGLIFFGGMMIGSSGFALSNGSIIGSLFFAAFWGFWVVLAVMALLSYYRESLFVGDGQVIQNGILRRREIAFVDVVSVRWRIAPAGGSVVLRSSADKIRVTFDKFEREQRRWLIRSLRLSLPLSIQQDWERFCLRNALPLLKHNSDLPLQPDEILLTRRRWDRFFLATTVVLLILGILCAWLLRSLPLLAFPLVSLLMWSLVRFSTPAEGLRHKKIPTQAKGYLLLFAVWCSIGVVIIASLGNSHNHLAIGLGIAWLAIFLYVGHRIDRRLEAARDAAAPAAAEEWARLEDAAGELGNEAGLG